MEILEDFMPEIAEFFKKYISVNQYLNEYGKEMALKEVEPALLAIESFFGDILKKLEKDIPQIEKISNDMMHRLYCQPAISSDYYFYRRLFAYLYLYSLKNILEEDMVKSIKRAMNEYAMKYPYFVIVLSLLADQVYCIPSPMRYRVDDIDKIHNILKPIKVTNLDGELKLYHGTSLDSYKKIVDKGYIRSTNYTDTENTSESTYRKMQTGYSFFCADLAYAVNYAQERGNEDALGIVKYVEESPLSTRYVDWRIRSGGVIFEIDAKKYLDRLYYVPANGEYLIAGNVDIREARVIFVKREKGVIGLLDEKGDKINDLCYE